MATGLKTNKRICIENQIDQLEELSRDELVKAWHRQFKVDPPKGVKRGLLERAAGFQLQTKRRGALKRESHKALLAIAIGAEPVACGSPRHKLAKGSRLMREWHGQTHYVDVTHDGFEWNGDRYSSLSAIALAITGTKWSGPRFFGVSS